MSAARGSPTVPPSTRPQTSSASSRAPVSSRRIPSASRLRGWQRRRWATTGERVVFGADAGVRYGSDLVQGIRDGVVTVTKVSVQPHGAVISFLDNCGSEIHVDAPLDTAGDASNVVEALFQALGAGVDR